MGTGILSGVNRPGLAVAYEPHLAPRLKEEYSYTSTPPQDIRGLLYVELYFNFTFTPKPDQALVRNSWAAYRSSKDSKS